MIDAAVAVVVLGGAAVVGLFALISVLTPTEDFQRRQWLRRWVVFALVLHVVCGLYIATTQYSHNYSDAFYYDQVAKQIVEHWSDGKPHFALPFGQEGFFYLLAGVYRVFGPHPVAGIVVNAFFSAALIPVMADLTGRLFGHDVSRRIPPLLVFIPGFLIWTSQLLREAGVLFFLGIAVYSAFRLSERVAFPYLLSSALSLGLLFTFRGYVAVLVTGSLVIAVALAQEGRVRGLVCGLGVLGLVALLVGGVGLGRSGYRSSVSARLEEATGLRNNQLAQTRSPVAPGADTSTAPRVVAALPHLVPRFLFGPFPGEYRSATQLLALPDALAWWLLLPSLCRGLVSGATLAGRKVITLLIPAGVTALALSLLIAEYGTVVRSRLQVMLLLLPIIALGIDKGRRRHGLSIGFPSLAVLSASGPASTSSDVPHVGSGMIERPTHVRFDLRRYLRPLPRHKWTIVLVFVLSLVACLALFVGHAPPYEASAEIRLKRNTGTDPAFTGPVNMQTEMRLVHSMAVRSAAEARLGTVASVRARPVPATDIFEVVATHSDADMAAKIANTYAESYLILRQQEDIQRTQGAIKRVEERLNTIQQEINETQAAIFEASDDRRGAIEQEFLIVRRDALVREQSDLKARLHNIGFDESLRAPSAELVAPAQLPSRSLQRQLMRAALCAAFAICSGLGAWYLAVRLDDTVRTEEDVRAAGQDSPVMGVIPRFRRSGKESPSGPALSGQSALPASEAYHAVRTSLNLLIDQRAARVLQMTSPAGGEGTSTTVANLGNSFSLTGRRVIVVDCDLRRPRIHELFGLGNGFGLTSVVAGSCGLREAMRSAPGKENLYILPAGPVPAGPSNVLSCKRMRELLLTLRQNSDLVILDCPPVLTFSDAVVVSALVDATILVVAADRTSRSKLRWSVARLQRAGGPLVGVVINRGSGY